MSSPATTNKEEQATTTTTSKSEDVAVTVAAVDDDTMTPPSREELTELVRAIKFANPDLSQRLVHKEITETLGEKVACLKDIPLVNVKKVWKKAIIAANNENNENNNDEGDDDDDDANQNTSKTIDNNNDENTNNGQQQPPPPPPQEGLSSENADLAEKLRGTIPEVFTVGDGTKVYEQLAKDYTAAHFAMQQQQQQNDDKETMIDKNQVHVFLDVPANKSGERPHQALINFQSSHQNQKNNSGGGGKKKKKDTKKSSKLLDSASNNSGSDNDSRIIVKIQRAAPVSSDDTAQHPMLLYDQSRTFKTFVHPDPNDDGYERLSSMIAEQGIGGALGQSGGTKAYFYARVTKRKKGANILSIETTELAPTQSW